MRGFIPPRPTGYDAEARFAQALWDASYGESSKVINSSTVRVSRTTRGTAYSAKPPAGAGSKPAPYVTTTLFNKDYIGARPWNPVSGTFSGSEVKVAKAIYARMIPGETIDTVAYTYDPASYTDNFRTQLESAAIFEYQVCHPRYRIYDPTHDISESLIFVERAMVGTGVVDDHGSEIYLLEVFDRFWSYQYGQTGPP